jgi:2-phospho-L-lactate guanylyltransferase
LLSPVLMPGIGWWRDLGRGLNAELAAARSIIGDRPLLVIFPDLPSLKSDDLKALLESSAAGVSIAGDRHNKGTNAIALADGRPFNFMFGKNSLSKHSAEAGRRGEIVWRRGLSHDIDDVDDLLHALNFDDIRITSHACPYRYGNDDLRHIAVGAWNSSLRSI